MSSVKDRQESIIKTLLNKYRADPERFRTYLPEVARELETLLPSRISKSYASSLTELERVRLIKSLDQLINGRGLTQGEAIKALEYCATLIQDESLPYEINRKIILNLIHQATGTPLSKVKKITKLQIGEGDIVKEIAILRGVHAHLTWNDRLVALSISPAKLEERSKALIFVGISKDAASDVAQRHDEYLVKAISNAA